MNLFWKLFLGVMALTVIAVAIAAACGLWLLWIMALPAFWPSGPHWFVHPDLPLFVIAAIAFAVFLRIVFHYDR